MAIQGIGALGVGGLGGVVSPQTATRFAATLKGQLNTTAKSEPHLEASPLKAAASQAKATSHETLCQKLAPAEPSSSPATPRPIEAAQVIDRLALAQKRMDAVLEVAQSGKSFTPAELLSLQTQMYSASQELDLAGKVVDKATAGVKQVLQTQV